MKKQIPDILRGMAAAAVTGAVLLCSGCGLGFNTMIMTDTDPPEAVLAQFFDALQAGDYAACDQWLADNERFTVVDNTEYDFLGELMDTAMSRLDYAPLEEIEYDATNAEQPIRVTALNTARLSELIAENYVNTEYSYLIENNKRTVDDESNHDDVSNIIKREIETYTEAAGTVQNEITVHFVYKDNGWKIVMDTELIGAIFGDDVK